MTAGELFPSLPPARLERCCGCPNLTSVPIPVRTILGTSGPRVVLYACAMCAPWLGDGPVPNEAFDRP